MAALLYQLMIGYHLEREEQEKQKEGEEEEEERLELPNITTKDDA